MWVVHVNYYSRIYNIHVYTTCTWIYSETQKERQSTQQNARPETKLHSGEFQTHVWYSAIWKASMCAALVIYVHVHLYVCTINVHIHMCGTWHNFLGEFIARTAASRTQTLSMRSCNTHIMHASFITYVLPIAVSSFTFLLSRMLVCYIYTCIQYRYTGNHV